MPALAPELPEPSLDPIPLAHGIIQPLAEVATRTVAHVDRLTAIRFAGLDVANHNVSGGSAGLPGWGRLQSEVSRRVNAGASLAN